MRPAGLSCFFHDSVSRLHDNVSRETRNYSERMDTIFVWFFRNLEGQQYAARQRY